MEIVCAGLGIPPDHRVDGAGQARRPGAAQADGPLQLAAGAGGIHGKIVTGHHQLALVLVHGKAPLGLPALGLKPLGPELILLHQLIGLLIVGQQGVHIVNNHRPALGVPAHPAVQRLRHVAGGNIGPVGLRVQVGGHVGGGGHRVTVTQHSHLLLVDGEGHRYRALCGADGPGGAVPVDVLIGKAQGQEHRPEGDHGPSLHQLGGGVGDLHRFSVDDHRRGLSRGQGRGAQYHRAQQRANQRRKQFFHDRVLLSVSPPAFGSRCPAP